MEMDGGFLMGEGELTLCGLGLDDEALGNIYCGNFLRFVGGVPRPVKARHVLAECARLRFMMGIMAHFDKSFTADYSAVDEVTSYFKSVSSIQ